MILAGIAIIYFGYLSQQKSAIAQGSKGKIGGENKANEKNNKPKNSSSKKSVKGNS